ncbi:MAG: hypothetical protein E7617_05820 [Ruminococcaceae bacterium]|nr:hypothetical protein [Oscillospiraceae bacterium]
MTTYEKAEARRLPKKYRPLGAWRYFWLNFLYVLPVIGQICLIVHAISERNINRRSYARCFLLAIIIGLVLVGVLALLLKLGVIDAAMFEEITNQLPLDI